MTDIIPGIRWISIEFHIIAPSIAFLLGLLIGSLCTHSRNARGMSVGRHDAIDRMKAGIKNRSRSANRNNQIVT